MPASSACSARGGPDDGRTRDRRSGQPSQDHRSVLGTGDHVDGDGHRDVDARRRPDHRTGRRRGRAHGSLFLLLHQQSIVVVIFVPIAFGLLVGGINGSLMSYLGVPAIIGTLGMMFIIRTSSSSSRTRETADPVHAPSRRDRRLLLHRARGSDLSLSSHHRRIAVVVAYLVTRRSTLGRYIDAVGGNARAAFLAGVSIRRVFASGFVISAVWPRSPAWRHLVTSGDRRTGFGRADAARRVRSCLPRHRGLRWRSDQRSSAPRSAPCSSVSSAMR